MKHILWVCSWYPNEVNKFRGDFIQRQAIATSAFCKIDVLHIVFSDTEKENKTQINSNLLEHIYYYKQKNKIINYYKAHLLIQEKVLLNSYQAVHLHIPMPLGFSLPMICKMAKIPLYVSEHYGIYNHFVEGSFYKRNFLFRYFTKKILNSAYKIIAVSQYLANDIKNIGIKNNIHVISNLVDSAQFYFVPKSNENPFRFIHVSNMLPIKNVEGILQAISIANKSNNHFEVTFIGAIPLHLISLKEKLALHNVTFINEISYNAIAETTKQHHAGILFSEDETQSCVALEWLCSGLPVITSAVGGVKELINTDNGILVEKNNIEQLAQAIILMIENYNTYNLQKISTLALEKYSYEVIGKKIAALYD